jgi:hypothetical protein
MTIEEIEIACDESVPLDFPSHPLEGPELTHREIYYPLGFPTVLTTNSPEILSQARELWSMFEQRFDTTPIRVDVQVVESDSAGRPPEPVYRLMHPLLTGVADKDNYSIVNLDEGRTQIVASRSAERHGSYLSSAFLGAAPLCHIATRYPTSSLHVILCVIQTIV